MVPNPADPTSRAFRVQIDARIADHLDQVEQRLAEVSPTLAPLIEVSRDLVTGGKRLRPALLLLAGKASGRLLPAHQVLAAVVESRTLDKALYILAGLLCGFGLAFLARTLESGKIEWLSRSICRCRARV